MSDVPIPTSDLNRQMFRHTLATLAYRGAKVIDGAPVNFGSFRISETTRTAGEIMAHICDLLEWALTISKGEQVWKDSALPSWHSDITRFFAALEEFDSYLASDAPLHAPVEKLFQAPIADALTHVGQIAMLRRVAGAPIRGENYFKADIVAGRVGSEQSTKRVEFD